MMNGPEKSDPAIVATKLANKAQPSAERSAGETFAAEPVERRAGTKGNAGQQSTRGALSNERPYRVVRPFRMRSSACDALSRLCVRRVLCWSAFPLVPALRSTGSDA